MNRRSWLKWMAAAPVYGVIAARAATDSLAAATRATTTGDVYRRLGVRPFINARGTWTYLSGSLELPEVRRAKEAAAQHFVDIFELQQAAGRELAELSGAESGMVTSGAAGAMAAATAAASPEPTRQDLAAARHHRSQERSRHARRTQRLRQRHPAGRREIRDRRARVERSRRPPSTRTPRWSTPPALGDRLETALAIAKNTNVPLLLDDAAGIPPIENLKTLRQMGVDLYCFSGGKGLARAAVLGHAAGPQGSDRSSAGATQPVGRRRVPGDEGRQGRDHGLPGRRRSVDEDGPGRAQQSSGTSASSGSQSWWRPFRA